MVELGLAQCEEPVDPDAEDQDEDERATAPLPVGLRRHRAEGHREQRGPGEEAVEELLDVVSGAAAVAVHAVGQAREVIVAEEAGQEGHALLVAPAEEGHREVPGRSDQEERRDHDEGRPDQGDDLETLRQRRQPEAGPRDEEVPEARWPVLLWKHRGQQEREAGPGERHQRHVGERLLAHEDELRAGAEDEGGDQAGARA